MSEDHFLKNRDPLLRLYGYFYRGDDYTGNSMHDYRLNEIDKAMEHLKKQGLMNESYVIDRPLQRHALAAYLKSLYPLHDSEHDTFPRHGRHETDLENYARTRHMECHGFDAQGSASYDPTSEQAMRDKAEASSILWGRFNDPSKGLRGHLDEIRYQYRWAPLEGYNGSKKWFPEKRFKYGGSN